MYEMIYQPSAVDCGIVRIGDLELTSGNFVRLGGVVFSPGQEIDFEYGPLRLKRERGSTLLKAFAPGELHVFLYWKVPLWTVRWYRFTPVAENASGEVDVSEDPKLPLLTRLRDRCISMLLFGGIGWLFWQVVAEPWMTTP